MLKVAPLTESENFVNDSSALKCYRRSQIFCRQTTAGETMARTHVITYFKKLLLPLITNQIHSIYDSSTIQITNRSNDRIVEIKDMDGTGWRTFSSGGSGKNRFNGTVDLARDSQGSSYISDRWNHRTVRL
jgi:hypothetical protein